MGGGGGGKTVRQTEDSEKETNKQTDKQTKQKTKEREKERNNYNNADVECGIALQIVAWRRRVTGQTLLSLIDGRKRLML